MIVCVTTPCVDLIIFISLSVHRRETLSRKFIATWKFRPQANVYNVLYNLRSGREMSVRQEARTKRAYDFITFRFLD